MLELQLKAAAKKQVKGHQYYVFPSPATHSNYAGRPTKYPDQKILKTYTGKGSNGQAKLHPDVLAPADLLMTALLQYGEYIDDWSIRSAVIQNGWRPDDASSTWDAGTRTYRAYNPERRLWEMQGINTNLGAWQAGLMWSAGADRVLIEWYGSMLVRFRYFAIQPDKFLWRADATFDRGKTWINDWWTMEVRRISR